MRNGEEKVEKQNQSGPHSESDDGRFLVWNNTGLVKGKLTLNFGYSLIHKLKSEIIKSFFFSYF